MGEYSHTIDTKGRLIVPSKFRESLGDSFVVTKGLDGCLFVYDMTEWKSFEEKLKELPMSHRDTRKFARFFLAGASQVEVDKQGRILIPAKLRKSAGLEKDLVFVGMINRVEIWDKDTFEAQTLGSEMSMEEAMDALGISL